MRVVGARDLFPIPVPFRTSLARAQTLACRSGHETSSVREAREAG